MDSNNSLDLLSSEAKELWFMNIKLTLDKISKVDLNLSRDFLNKMKEISHSLDIILSHKNKLDNVKLKKGGDSIMCDDVSLIFVEVDNLLKELLWTDDKEEIKAEIELAIEEKIENKKNAAKSDEDRKKYVESIRFEKELKNKLEKIVLLENIKSDIKSYREKLSNILDKKLSKENKKDGVVIEKIAVIENIQVEIEEGIITQDELLKLEDEVEVKEENNNKKLDLDKIKSNLKNKKMELPKQNSQYSEVLSFFAKEKRITFYHLGLYNLYKWLEKWITFNNNEIVNLITLLNINDSIKLFLEWYFWKSSIVIKTIFLKMVNISSRIDEKYYWLVKTFYLYLINLTWEVGLRINEKTEYNEKYRKFLKYMELKDEDLELYDIDFFNTKIIEMKTNTLMDTNLGENIDSNIWNEIPSENNDVVEFKEEVKEEINDKLEKKDITKNRSTKILDKIKWFTDEEEFIKYYKKALINFNAKKNIEYFLVFLDKFIEFGIKTRPIFTIKKHILRIDENYIFSESQKAFFENIENNKEEKKENNDWKEKVIVKEKNNSSIDSNQDSATKKILTLKQKEEELKIEIARIKEEKEKLEISLREETFSNIDKFVEKWKFKELKWYINSLESIDFIDNVLLIKKMVEALLKADNANEVKEFLYDRD